VQSYDMLSCNNVEFNVIIDLLYKVLCVGRTEWRNISTSQSENSFSLFFNWYSLGGGVQLGPLGTVSINRPIVPAPVLTFFCSHTHKTQAIPVTSCEGPHGCETLRLLHFSRQSAPRWR
jgi:hypothetical protein